MIDCLCAVFGTVFSVRSAPLSASSQTSARTRRSGRAEPRVDPVVHPLPRLPPPLYHCGRRANLCAFRFSRSSSNSAGFSGGPVSSSNTLTGVAFPRYSAPSPSRAKSRCRSVSMSSLQSITRFPQRDLRLPRRYRTNTLFGVPFFDARTANAASNLIARHTNATTCSTRARCLRGERRTDGQRPAKSCMPNGHDRTRSPPVGGTHPRSIPSSGPRTTE